jgi:hypothetical protein
MSGERIDYRVKYTTKASDVISMSGWTWRTRPARSCRILRQEVLVAGHWESGVE